MYAALDDNSLIEDKSFVGALDNLIASLRNIRFAGQTEMTTETDGSTSAKVSGKAKFSASAFGGRLKPGVRWRHRRPTKQK